MNAPYQAIRCADGYITLGAANERLFRRLCEVLGHAEWSADAAFADNASRVTNRDALAARIEAITVTQPRAHWLALLDANDIPCGPINDYAQVFADPQVRRARDGRRDRSPDARASADARLADQDERDAARRLAAARRSSASTRTRCCARAGLLDARDRDTASDARRSRTNGERDPRSLSP